MKFLSRILFYLSSFSILPPSRAEQDLILERVLRTHQSKPDFMRQSLRQYDCHSYYFYSVVWVAFNLFSMVAVVPLFLILTARSLKKIRFQSRGDISLYQRIPKTIQDQFAPVYTQKPMGYLKVRDFKYILPIILKSGFRPYFVFRSIWKIAVYSELIDTYRPARIWVTQEMVFESSLLTSYLHDFNIKHINFMHGDNYFSIQVAFCTFSEFYVWHPFYMDLFRSLHVDAQVFHVFPALDRLTSSFTPRDVVKYYNQESENVKNFNQVMDNLIRFSKNKNCQLVVRLHPLHKKQFEIDALSERKIELEPNSVDFVDSLYESKYVCSEFSSVLYQASMMNKHIVIDNTFPERIELIKDLDPIFIKQLEHEFLVTS